jgi:hypothetical protein
MKKRATKTADMGCVVRQMRRGDTVYIKLGGRVLGFVECIEVPTKARVAFTFNKSLRIERQETTEESNAGTGIDGVHEG